MDESMNQPANILIVDDEPYNLDYLQQELEDLGHQVTTAVNGQEALRQITATPPDLMLLDIMMPQMDGFQVLNHLRAHPSQRNLPVIIISAINDVASIAKGIQLGAEDFLPKPFDPIILKARIAACLEKKRLRDREILHLQQIEAERKRANDLLHVILPEAIISELKATNTVKPRYYPNVAILFADIVDFTPYCNFHTPEEVFHNLQELFEAYEELALRYELQKIKTIGDAFMASAGLLKAVENPVLNCVQCGLEMIAIANNLSPAWQIRVGVHIGPVMAGVVGHRQYSFDVWGDTVNTAQRLESHGTVNAVNLSANSWEQVNGRFAGASSENVLVKGKGTLEIIHIPALAERKGMSVG